ncbi:putative membrane protein [Sphingomonas sp. UYAg733]
MTVVAFTLIGLAVVPLLLVGLTALACYFELGVADHILSVTVRALKFQWISGSVLNIVAGLAVAALGIWAILHFDPLAYRLLAALLVPFGLWRTFSAVALLRGISTGNDAP